MAVEAERAFREPVARPIAQGDGWHINDVVCRLGPQDRPSEERFGGAMIAAVIEGTFRCRTAAGNVLLYPGAFLLGEAGSDFECSHDHGVGDRCIAFHFDAALFDEIAATSAGSHRFRFPTAMLPASRKLARPVLESALHAGGRGLIAPEELAIGLAEAVVTTLAGNGDRISTPSAREMRRIIGVLRHVEEHSDRELSLADLASLACMSKYHFLRIFRMMLGITPYQFLLDLRMRRAAMKLRTTAEPISVIALDSGFGDLSTFNHRFRSLFGHEPRRVSPLRRGTLAPDHAVALT